jgi:hypothetical protein
MASAMDYEKNQYTIGAGSGNGSDHGVANVVHEKGAAVGEATDMYGGKTRDDSFRVPAANNPRV